MKFRVDPIYKEVFDATKDAIFVYHAGSGKLLVVNEGAEKLFSCAKEELLAGSVDKFSLGESPYSAKEMISLIKKTVEEGSQRFEWLSRTADGKLFWTEISLTHTTVNDMDIVIAIVRNISTQKELEKKLSLSEARYRTLFEFMADGVAVYKAIGDGDDFIFLDFNRAAERIEKINRSDVIGKHLTEVFPGVEEFGFLDVLKKVYKTGVPVHHPVNFYKDDRILGWRENYVYKLPSGEIVAVYQDRTKEEEAKEALIERTEFLNSLIDAMPTGVIVATPKRTIEWVSKKFEEITGYSMDELKGANTRILYPSDEEYEKVKIAYLILDYDKEADIESIWQTKEGKSINVLLRGTKIKTKDGEKIVATVLDITNLKKMEQERIEMEKRLGEVQRLESLGLIAGGIAHDFNNILMGIMGNAELAVIKSQDKGQAAQLKTIIKSCQYASRLCNQLLSYAGKGEVEPQIINVADAISSLQEFLVLSTSKKTTLELKLDHSIPPVVMDPAQLKQIIVNLVINASEAIEKKIEDHDLYLFKGDIKISTDATQKEQISSDASLILEPGKDVDTFVTITVSDNGCGMDDKTKHRIFDPFFTTKLFGRGLGMANVMGIVRGCGGYIQIESRKGHGTTVRIGLPPATHLTHPARTPSPKQESGGKLPEKPVLLIDDDPNIGAVAVELIRALGMDTVACTSGLEGVSIIQKEPDKYSCIICDLTMPGMSGKDTILEIRRFNPNIPVVITSGLSRQQVMDELEGIPVAGFLQKPYSLAELKKTLENLH